MYVMPRERMSFAHARLTTDYRVTDGYCVELYYVISGAAVLTVKIRGEDNIERNIASTTTANEVNAQMPATVVRFWQLISPGVGITKGPFSN